MSSHKEYRNPPPKDFKKYTFTKFFSNSSSSKIQYERFVKVEIPDSQISEDISLGFDFKFNEKVYDRVNVSIKGFFVLREKDDNNTFNPLDYFEFLPDSEEWISPNLLIKDEFESTGVLFCPWIGNLYSTNEVGLIKNTAGEEPPFDDVHHFDNGVNFIRASERNGLKTFVLRWKAYSGDSLLEDENKIVLSFESILKEDGKVEFKYYPVKKLNNPFVQPGFPCASIGIFVNDDGWNFRDLTDDIGYLNNEREKNEYGGYSLTDYLDDAVDVSNEVIGQKPYSVSLLPIKGSSSITVNPELRGKPSNWPGGEKNSCVFYFTPPQRRRIVLPKRVASSRSNLVTNPPALKSLVFNKISSRTFDDRYVSNTEINQILNMPLGIPRFFGDGLEGVESRQNLFSDVVVTSKMNQSDIDQYIYEKKSEYSEPFLDDTLNEVEDFQFEIDLPVVHELEMTHTCSSIYYYNKRASGFFMPYSEGLVNPVSQFLESEDQNQPNDWKGFGPTGVPFVSSSLTSTLFESTPELSILTPENSTNEPWKSSNRGNFLEKKYSFSLQNSSNYSPDEDEVFELPIGLPFSLERMVIEFPFEADSSWFDDKTVTSTVIGEFPENGKIKGYSNKILDFAGPALTFSLFHKTEAQTSEATLEAQQKNLNLVARGTLTHQGDVESNISTRVTWTQTLKSSNTSPNEFERVWIFEPEGFKSFFGEPDASIESNQDDGSFSGNVSLNLEAKVSNGAVASFFMTLPKIYSSPSPGITPEKRKDAVKDLFKSRKFKFTKPNNESLAPTLNFNIQNSLKTVDPFGVSKDGSFLSSRVIGPKIASIPNDLHGIYFDYIRKTTPDADNPFYLADNFEDFPQPIQDIINGEQSLNAIFHATIPILGEEKTSYLLMPGDKLSLAVSKFRPALTSQTEFLGSVFPNFRHGNEHVLKIKPGSIKVKFYGKVLRNFESINLDQKQQFTTFSISEPISSGPVVDEFELFSHTQFAGSYTDDFVFGSLKDSIGKQISWVEKPYGIRLFSKTLAELRRFAWIVLDSNDFSMCSFVYNFEKFSNFLGLRDNSQIHDDSILIDACEDHLYRPSSRSERLRPKSDFCGSQRIVRISDENERLYDTMMPSLQDCFEIDQTTPYVLRDINTFPDIPSNPDDDIRLGKNIFIEPVESIGGYSSTSSTPGFEPNWFWDRYGTLLFNSPKSVLGIEESVPDFSVNNSWFWSFPFEDKYLTARRTLDFESISESNYLLSNLFKADSSVIVQEKEDFNLEKIHHFIPSRTLRSGGEISVNFLIDVNMLVNKEDNFDNIEFFEKKGLSGSDLYKVMFGFGDDNTVYKLDGDETLYGHNRQAKFRETIEISDTFYPSSRPRDFRVSPIIRGWKFGVLSGTPINSSMVFRRGRFGQFRDMLEQRVFAKSLKPGSERYSLDDGPVSVKFVDYLERSVDPTKTYSQNITKNASCGFPYIDGIAKNRPDIDITILGRTYFPIDI